MAFKLTIVIPVYDDWNSLRQLLRDIDRVLDNTTETSIIVVNDASSVECTDNLCQNLQNLRSVEVLTLSYNMGHQRAIAIGLCDASTREECNAIIVMDSDGEDQPEDLKLLLSSHAAVSDNIIVAKRAKRSEGWIFTSFYVLYKAIFRILTGQGIAFGNFMLIPFHQARRLALMPDIWNNLAGAILKSRLPITSVPTSRGNRYAGRSKVNFTSLILHGLGIVSVFVEVCSIRLLLFSLGMMLLALLGVLIVSSIRIFTLYAIPGWTSYLVSAFLILFLQALLISVYSVFLALNTRSNAPIIPLYEANTFIVNRQVLYAK
jgi:polyisoprenyl-phosphate glycosyltransferase